MTRLIAVGAAVAAIVIGRSVVAAQGRRGAAPAPSRAIAGQVVWGETFSRRLPNGLILEVELLGDDNDADIGFYVSLWNRTYPKPYQFVLLPYLLGGRESNSITVFARHDDDPGDVRAALEERLEQARRGVGLTYFLGRFTPAQLEAIDEARIRINHHGGTEEEYARLRAILDRLDKRTAEIRVLDYTIDADRSAHRWPRIASLKFSFEWR